MDGETLFRLVLAALGFLAFLTVILASTRHMSRTASSWTKGGAVALAVAGLFGLLLALGRST